MKGVIQVDQPILEIVPTENGMLVEAYVKPSEVAFWKVDQQAVVKLSSYDFNKYGGLEGELEHLGPDTLKDERQQRRPGPIPPTWKRVITEFWFASKMQTWCVRAKHSSSHLA